MTAFSSSSSSSSSHPPPQASETITDVQRAGAHLRAGGLVAFPTETVYGLGANAHNEAAVHRIFEVKGRPLTDPLIVHVSQTEDAWEVFACGATHPPTHPPTQDTQAREKAILSTLANTFWPGPLTLVAPAAPHLPRAVSAGTGWVGVRVPAHSLARALIQAAQVGR